MKARLDPPSVSHSRVRAGLASSPVDPSLPAKAGGAGVSLRRFAVAACALLLTGVASAQFSTRIVADGLTNPRGLTFGPDGALYVTEAGSPFMPGPDTPSLIIRGQPAYFGTSGSISKWTSGGRTDVLTGLPSLFSPSSNDITGAHGIGFSATGDLYYTVGLGANPTLREGAELSQLGLLMRLPAGGTTPEVVADLAAFEAANNPAGGPLDSNPFKLQVHAGGVLVADAGANALLNVSFDGTIDLVSTLSPLISGAESVPTSVAIGPDGAVYVSELTGFPFPVGGASIFRVEDAGLTLVGGGFTNVIDMKVGPDGMLYVLEFAHNGLLSGDPTGGVWRVNPTTGVGNLIISEGLMLPTALAFDEAGTLYIANAGVIPGAGQVIAFRPVPEPAVMGSVAGVALVGLVLWRRRRTKPATVVA